MTDCHANPTIEIVATGDELRLGEIADTNSACMARMLTDGGVEVSRITVVGDSRAAIAAAVREAISRADAVIVTGGLGPTLGDMTREALADVMGVELETRPEALQHLQQWLRRPLSELDRRQALAPRGAELIPNLWGSASGLKVHIGGKTIYALPGVPREMCRMFETSVLPELLAMPHSIHTATRYLVTHGMPESKVVERLLGLIPSGASFGTRARSGTITVRFIARAPSREEAERKVELAAAGASEALGECLAGSGDRDMAELVAAELLAKKLRVALAESCTGGMVASRLVGVSGISEALLEAVVAYSNTAKTARLGVEPGLIAEKGAVSAEVARAMAEGVRQSSGADIGLSVTGIAGPSGGSETKPVGLVYLATSSAQGCEVTERHFKGERNEVRERATEEALWLLLKEARRLGGSPCATA